MVHGCYLAMHTYMHIIYYFAYLAYNLPIILYIAFSV